MAAILNADSGAAPPAGQTSQRCCAAECELALHRGGGAVHGRCLSSPLRPWATASRSGSCHRLWRVVGGCRVWSRPRFWHVTQPASQYFDDRVRGATARKKPRRHSAGRRHRRDSFRIRRSTHDNVTKQCAPAPPAADPPAVMISTTTVAWAAAGAATTGLSARAAFRLSVSRDRPRVAGCPRCGRSFRAGIGGWLPGLRRCAGCHQINGPPWWALAVPGALVCGLLAARLPPSDAAGWALLVAWQLLAQAGIVLSVIDIAVHRLPTRTVTGTGVAITAAIATASGLQHSSQTLTRAGLGAVTAASVYLLLFMLVPDGVGAGDVRLAAVTGLTLGSSSWRTVLWGIVLPYLLCFPFAVVSAIRRHGDAHDAAHIPFGPFLIVGAILAGIASR